MITREALTSAQMHLAGVTDEARLRASFRSAAAHNTVALLAHTLGKVLAGQCMSRVEACSAFAWGGLGRQLLQQLVHELLAEA